MDHQAWQANTAHAVWGESPPRKVPAPDCGVASNRITYLSFQEWSDTDARRTDLQQCALRIGEAHTPFRTQDNHKPADGLDCTRDRRHATTASTRNPTLPIRLTPIPPPDDTHPPPTI